MQSLVAFPISVSGLEDMALRSEQRDFIRDEINLQLNLAVDAFRPHGWRKITHFLREWGLAASANAVPLALLGICVAVGIFAASGIKENTQFRTRTEDKLATIDGDIKAIRADLIKQGLLNHASMPLPDFRASLPDLGVALATAKQQDVKTSPEVIDGIRQKLIASGTTAAGFWPTAAQFISYQSQIGVIGFQGLQRPNLPNCVDSDPTPMNVTSGSNEAPPINVSPSHYDNCVFTLDSARDDAKINSLLEAGSVMIAFRHCFIIYHGGQVDLKLVFSGRPSVISMPNKTSVPLGLTIRAVRFENCLFNFAFVKAPTPQGQEITKKFLAEQGAILELPVQKPSSHS